MTQDEINALLVEHGHRGCARSCGSRAAIRSCSVAAARRPRRWPPRGSPFEVVPGDHERDRRARLRGHPGHAPRRLDPLHRRHRPRGPGEGPHRRRLGGARARRRHARDPDGRGPHRRHRDAARSRPVVRPTHRSPRSATAPARTSARRARRWPRSPTSGVQAPSAIVVGDVAALDLVVVRVAPAVRAHGRRHACTRAGQRAARPARGARRRRARAAVDRDRATRLRRARPRASTWVVFTSANGVLAFFDRGLAAAGLDARGARRRCGSPPSVRARRRAGRRTVCGPTSCPSASSPSRCSRRSRRRRSRASGAARARRAGPRRAARGARRARATPSTCSPVYRTVPAEPDAARSSGFAAAPSTRSTFTSSSTVTNFCDLVGQGARSAATRRLDRSGHVGAPHANAVYGSTSKPTGAHDRRAHRDALALAVSPLAE